MEKFEPEEKTRQTFYATGARENSWLVLSLHPEKETKWNKKNTSWE
ncbi:MAG: hypothetical protein WC914_00880 [Proteiniphilum sp.]|jgi:hypothetical protein